MAGKPIATIGSMHVCPMCTGYVPHVGGPISGPGAPNVLINKKPVALMGDMCVCVGPPDVIAQGHPLVKVNGVPVVCVGDLTAHGGSITMGEPNVMISTAVPTPSVTMPKEKIPFPTINFVNRAIAVLSGNSLTEANENQQALADLATETPIPEDSTEVTLETTFAMAQLHAFADSCNLKYFIIQMIDIYGADIPSEAYKQLYHDAKNNASVLIPTLLVKQTISEGGKALFYNNTEVQEIWVGEQIIRDAAAKNDSCGELLVILIEEYGHFIDYLLRNHYAQTERKDALRDEGAYFSYRMLQLNTLDTSDQFYADATIDGAAHPLTWDYEPYHKAIKEFVGEERWTSDDHFGPFEFYKAGFLDKKEGQYSHGNIEREGLTLSFSKSNLGFTAQVKRDEINNYLLNIYFGNWKRDFSQGLDPKVLRMVSNTIEIIATEASNLKTGETIAGLFENLNKDRLMTQTLTPEYEVTFEYNKLSGIPKWIIDLGSITFSPVKQAVKIICTLLEMSAVKEFIHAPIEKAEDNGDYTFLKKQVEKAELHANGAYKFPKKLLKQGDNKERSVLNYSEYLNLLKYNFTPVDYKHLGVCVAAEHIDNPIGSGMDPKSNDTNLLPKFMGNELGCDDTDNIHAINKDFGMKNYIRRIDNGLSEIMLKPDHTRFKNSHNYILYKLNKACINPKFKGYNSPEAKDLLGAALHTLEDFFAHSNYAELALIKEGYVDVFPWVSNVNGKINYLKYRKDSEYRNTVNKSSTYDIINETVGINGSNKLTTKIPLVTGTFGMLDTAASVLPIIAHMFDPVANQAKKTKNKEKEDKQKKEDGPLYYKDQLQRRTFNDVLLLELLRDLTNEDSVFENDEASTSSTSETPGIKKDSKTVKFYLGLLASRDGYNEYLDAGSDYVKDEHKETLGDAIEAAGKAVDWVLTYPKKLLNKLTIIIDTVIHSMVLFIADNLNDAQVYLSVEIKELENQDPNNLSLSIGIDPTHTQVAKDDPHHPMHSLSAELAIEAVNQVGTAVFNQWRGVGSFEKEVTAAVDKIIRHPAQSTWQSAKVKEWAAGTSIIKEHDEDGDKKGVSKTRTVKNTRLICEASSPSIVIKRLAHVNEEIEEILKDLKKISESPLFKKMEAATSKIIGDVKKDNPDLFKQIAEKHKNAEILIEDKIQEIEDLYKAQQITYFDKIILKIEATKRDHELRLMKIQNTWDEQFPASALCRFDDSDTSDHTLYTIKFRDTLSEIAKNHNVTEEAIMDLNPTVIENRHQIKAGDKILIPKSSTQIPDSIKEPEKPWNSINLTPRDNRDFKG